MRFFLPAVIKQVPENPVQSLWTAGWQRGSGGSKKRKRLHIFKCDICSRVSPSVLSSSWRGEIASARVISEDKPRQHSECVLVWRLWGCWCPDVTFTHPDCLIFGWWKVAPVVELAGRDLQIVNHYVSSSGGELVQNWRHLAQGGQPSSGFVKLTVKSVPDCFLATSWRAAFWQVLEKCWKAAQSFWMQRSLCDLAVMFFFWGFFFGRGRGGTVIFAKTIKLGVGETAEESELPIMGNVFKHKTCKRCQCFGTCRFHNKRKWIHAFEWSQTLSHLSSSAEAPNDFWVVPGVGGSRSGGIAYCTIKTFFHASGWGHATRFSESWPVLKRFGCHTRQLASGLLHTFNNCIDCGSSNHVKPAQGAKLQLLPLLVVQRN